DAQLDDADGVRNDPRVVLVVGVDHDHDVGAVVEAVAVAGLLVAAVAGVLVVDDDGQAHGAGDGDGVVGAAIVDEEDVVHTAGGEVGECRGERGLGVVCGKNRDDLVRTAGKRFNRFQDAIDVEGLV